MCSRTTDHLGDHMSLFAALKALPLMLWHYSIKFHPMPSTPQLPTFYFFHWSFFLFVGSFISSFSSPFCALPLSLLSIILPYFFLRFFISFRFHLFIIHSFFWLLSSNDIKFLLQTSMHKSPDAHTHTHTHTQTHTHKHSYTPPQRFPQMRSVTNIYLFNLALCDFCYLWGIPITATTLYHR